MKTKRTFFGITSHTALTLAILAALLTATAALAAAGALDPTFDGDGKVVTDIGSADRGQAVAIQPDGKIVVAGYSDNLGENNYALARYNSNGSLDATFDYDGKVVTDIRDDDYGEAIALQADGKIVVAGYSVTGSNFDFSLARYNSDGSLDATFDGDGKVVTDIGGYEHARDMLILSDGRIVVAGASNNLGELNYALTRYNSDGSLDTTFDGDGIVVTDIRDSDSGEAIALQTDGKIVVAGISSTSGNLDFSLARYNSDGSLDATFDGDGKVVTDIGGNDYAYDMLIQPDGRIVVAGISDNLVEYNYALARYNSNGSLDTSFDGDGIVVTDIRDSDYGWAIALQTDGKIVVAGESLTGGEYDFSLARYNNDGSLDTTFDSDGKVVTDIGDFDSVNAIAIQSDGRIVAAGESEWNFALVRYLVNNAPTNIALSNSAVAENQPTGTLVGNLSTTDPDPGDTFTYSFCGGAGDGFFKISGSQLQTNAVLDYETNISYLICILSNDGHGGTVDDFFVINIIDVYEDVNDAPTDISLSNSSINENLPAGTTVGTLSTTDPDPGDTHTYTFCGGADDGSFSIVGDALQTDAVFDYETKNSYSICVRTDDGHGGTFDKTFTINVMDEAETFTATFRSVGANDGWVLESSETSTKGGTLDSASTTFRLGDEAGDKQYRAILHFDTSALPENAVITEALLKIKKQGLLGTNPFNILGGLKVDMRKPYFGANTGLVISDFQAAAGKTAVGTFVSFPTLGNWYSAGLNATGRAYVNKTGTTQFRLRFATDDNNDNGADYMKFYSGNYATVSARPTLVIEYYIP